MTITLRMFAQIREATGASEAQVSLSGSATGRDVWEWVRGAAPALSLPYNACRLAVNHEFVPFDTALKDGDEVAILTPVAGG